MAARAISESLQLALNDSKIPPEVEINRILKDADGGPTNAHAAARQSALHRTTAALIQEIIVGDNSVRHP